MTGVETQWLHLVSQYGVPLVMLMFVAVAAWRSGVWAAGRINASGMWLADHVLTPLTETHLGFLNKMETALDAQTKTLTRIDGQIEQVAELISDMKSVVRECPYANGEPSHERPGPLPRRHHT